MKNKNQKIYTVTTLYIDPTAEKGKFPKSYRSRTWGFYYSLDDAIRGMKVCCSDDAGHYNHCVIERYNPGIYSVANFEKWYAWDDFIDNSLNKWIECSKPEILEKTINFAIG